MRTDERTRVRVTSMLVVGILIVLVLLLFVFSLASPPGMDSGSR